MESATVTRKWVVEPARPKSRNVHNLRFLNVRAGWEQYVLLTGDRHHDNVHTDHGLEKRHLDLAVERDAPIIDVGDLFCAMQGKYDPRKNANALRPEHRGENYFDALLDTAEQFYSPYARQFAVIGMGNHETAILKRQQINLTYNLTRRLRRHNDNAAPFMGGYGGWVVFRFDQGGRKVQSLRLKYFHGSGGGGPVTRGVIQSNRMAVNYPDANIIVSGHTHDAWVLPIKQERITIAGVVNPAIQWHIRTPTYKDEYGDGYDGWHVERGASPKPVGCVWLRFWYQNHQIKHEAILDAQ